MATKQVSPTDWRAVAQMLADRLAHHAYCDQHPTEDEDPDNCPWCADRKAYRVWALLARQPPDPPDPFPGAQTVSVFAILRHTKEVPDA